MSNSSSGTSDAVMPTGLPDTDLQQQEALLKALIVTAQRYFGGLGQLFESVTDPRHPLYITYPLSALATAGVLMFLFRLGARRQIGHVLHGRPLGCQVRGALWGERLPTWRHAQSRLCPIGCRPSAGGGQQSGSHLDSKEGAVSLPSARLLTFGASLQAELSNGKVHHASFIGFKPMPLYQKIEQSHSVANATLEVLPFAMHDLLEMTNQR